MANPTWPSSLPVPLIENVTYRSQGSNVIRTQMEGGAQKMRRRYTFVPEVMTFRLVLNRAQCYVLNEFFITTLRDVGPFDWVEFRDPARGAAIYRVRERPVYTVITGQFWYADIELDLLTPFSGTFPISDEIDRVLTTPIDIGITT